MIPQRYKKKDCPACFIPLFRLFSNLAKERRGRDFYPPIITVGHPTAIVPPGAVVPVVRLFPADDAFAQCGEGGDAALGDGDVTPYLLYFARFGFYLTHPSTFMHQNGGHATDDRHQDQIPGKNFCL